MSIERYSRIASDDFSEYGSSSSEELEELRAISPYIYTNELELQSSITSFNDDYVYTAYGNNVYVCTNYKSIYCGKNPDFSDLTEVYTSLTPASLCNVSSGHPIFFCNNRFIIPLQSSDTSSQVKTFLYSTDGINWHDDWTVKISFTSSFLADIVSFKGKYILIASINDSVLGSEICEDGTIGRAAFALSGKYRAFCVYKNTSLLIAYGSCDITSTEDGLNFTKVSTNIVDSTISGMVSAIDSIALYTVGAKDYLYLGTPSYTEDSTGKRTYTLKTTQEETMTGYTLINMIPANGKAVIIYKASSKLYAVICTGVKVPNIQYSTSSLHNTSDDYISPAFADPYGVVIPIYHTMKNMFYFHRVLC